MYTMKLDAQQMMNRLRIYKKSDFPKVGMKLCHNTICTIRNKRTFTFLLFYYEKK